MLSVDVDRSVYQARHPRLTDITGDCAGVRLGWDRPGPLAAVREFLAGDDRFVMDAERERYLITYNPGGFLKRVK